MKVPLTIDKDSYLLKLCRYVVLNPVRAGMVKHASDWPWSSYRAMSGEATAVDFLHLDWLLSQFGRTSKKAYVKLHHSTVSKIIKAGDENPRIKT